MLIFGTQGREEPRGIVADRCAECGRITRMVVVAHLEVGHVYFMPIGEARHKQTSMQCLDCRRNFVFKRQRYAEIMPMAFGRTCDIDELIVRTNPSLAQALGLLLEDDPGDDGHVLRPARVETCRCPRCSYERRRPFRFCPRCGTRSI